MDSHEWTDMVADTYILSIGKNRVSLGGSTTYEEGFGKLLRFNKNTLKELKTGRILDLPLYAQGVTVM